jgi:HprK-related kinase B
VQHDDAWLSPVSATLHLQFADFRIDVETNSLRLASRLQSYFRAHLAREPRASDAQLRAIVGNPEYDGAFMQVWSRPSAPGRVPKESYQDAGGVRQILKNRTGVLITLSDDRVSISGDLEAHANQVINLVGTLFGLSLLDRGYVMVHASAVVDAGSGQALVFLGNSGSGKSSLALQLIERGGYDFLSNDRVLMRSEGDGVRIFGLPKKPRVNPGTLLSSAALSRLVPRPRRRIYEQLPRDELWRLEEKTDVDVERELGARTHLTAPLGVVYSLEWRVGGHGLDQRELDADAALDALQATAKDFGPYDLSAAGRDQSIEFRRIASRARFIGVSGKADPAGFAELLAGGAQDIHRPLARGGSSSPPGRS